ncbi:MAG: hypothetical protein R3C49_24400 [Planctomycetaceae bacterium]
MKTASLKTLAAGLMCLGVTGILSAQDPFFAPGGTPYNSRMNDQYRGLPASHNSSYQALQQYRNGSPSGGHGYLNGGLDYRSNGTSPGMGYSQGTAASRAQWLQAHQQFDANGNPIRRTDMKNRDPNRWGMNGAGHYAGHVHHGSSVTGQCTDCANGGCDCADGHCTCPEGQGSCADGQCSPKSGRGSHRHNHGDANGSYNGSVNPGAYNSDYLTRRNLPNQYLPTHNPYGY